MDFEFTDDQLALRDNARSVTTETRPWTAGSMMKVRPVTRVAGPAQVHGSAHVAQSC